MDVRGDVERLVRECARLGARDANGRVVVKFGVLVRDDDVANAFEALNGTLRAGKKTKRLHFEGEILLQGAHDDVDVVVLDETGAREGTDARTGETKASDAGAS